MVFGVGQQLRGAKALAVTEDDEIIFLFGIPIVFAAYRLHSVSNPEEGAVAGMRRPHRP